MGRMSILKCSRLVWQKFIEVNLHFDLDPTGRLKWKQGVLRGHTEKVGRAIAGSAQILHESISQKEF
jgi:hypothetical protein